MAARCACEGCASGRNGAYVQLLHAAQADQDQAHRQQAMDVIARIAPLAGGRNTAVVDALAQPQLNLLYPQTGSHQQVLDRLLAETHASADALIADIRAGRLP